jgi:hypothetical protein
MPISDAEFTISPSRTGLSIRMASLGVRKARKDEKREGISPALLVPAQVLKGSRATKCAYLQKRSSNGLISNWKRRWTVLDAPDKALFYYESEVSAAPKGEPYVAVFRQRRCGGCADHPLRFTAQ